MILNGESNGQSSFVRCWWFRLGGRGRFANFQWCMLKCHCMSGVLNSWMINIHKFEFRALKSCHLVVPKWIFMKFQNFKIFSKRGRFWPLTCLKMLVGPRWREFQCLAASRSCASPLSSILSFVWCESFSVGEAFSEKQGCKQKMYARGSYW